MAPRLEQQNRILVIGLSKLIVKLEFGGFAELTIDNGQLTMIV